MRPEKASKRWPRLEEPVVLRVWVKGNYGPSRALFWHGEVFVLKAGISDGLDWSVERHDGEDVLFVVSENSKLGYRSAERFFPGAGSQVEAEVYAIFLPMAESVRKKTPVVGAVVMVRESTDDVFFDGDSYDEVSDMGMKEFLDHASEYW